MRSVVIDFIKPKPNSLNMKMWARLTLQPNYTYTNVIINVFKSRDLYKASAPEFSIQIVSVCSLTRPPSKCFSETPIQLSEAGWGRFLCVAVKVFFSLPSWPLCHRHQSLKGSFLQLNNLLENNIIQYHLVYILLNQTSLNQFFFLTFQNVTAPFPF